MRSKLLEEAYIPPYRCPVRCISRTLSCTNTFGFCSTVCRFECHASRARRTGFFAGFFTKLDILCLCFKMVFMSDTCHYRDYSHFSQSANSIHGTSRYLVCKVHITVKTSGSSRDLQYIQIRGSVVLQTCMLYATTRLIP